MCKSEAFFFFKEKLPLLVNIPVPENLIAEITFLIILLNKQQSLSKYLMMVLEWQIHEKAKIHYVFSILNTFLTLLGIRIKVKNIPICNFL